MRAQSWFKTTVFALILFQLCFLLLFFGSGYDDKEKLSSDMDLSEDEKHEGRHELVANTTAGSVILPPLILVSSPCSGSSFVIDFAQNLLRRHLGIEAYKAEWLEKIGEYLATQRKNVKNPNYNYELAETNESLAGKEMVHKTYEIIARNASQAMIAKLLPRHIVPGVVAALQDLKARFVMVYRQNLLEQKNCAIRDCFGEWKGHTSVFENGTRSNLCFGRRNRPELRVLARFNITNFSQSMESLMDQWGCEESLRDPKVKGDVDDQLEVEEGATDNFPRLVLERLEAFEYTEYNTAEFNASLAEWKIFLRGWGVEPQESVILEEMRVQGINVRKHKSALNSIYNKDEVEGLFKKWASNDNGFCDWQWMTMQRYMYETV